MAVLTAIVYSGGMSFILLKVINLVIPIRADASTKSTGLDLTQHGEEAYLHEGGGQK
jgi:Amt family ammonium transporter